MIFASLVLVAALTDEVPQLCRVEAEVLLPDNTAAFRDVSIEEYMSRCRLVAKTAANEGFEVFEPNADFDYYYPAHRILRLRIYRLRGKDTE